MVSSTLRNALALGACCASGGASAFAPPPPAAIKSIPSSSSSSLRYNLRNPDGGPGRGGRPAYDPFSPSPPRMRQNDAPPPPSGPRRSFEEPPTVDLGGQVVVDRQSNLSYNGRVRTPSVNEDPRGFDYERRYSQRPDYGREVSGGGRPGGDVGNGNQDQSRRSWWESAPQESGGRIQGGSRHTYHSPYDRDANHVFLESDGRPIDVEFEVWDGPNNTPTRMRVYSEDGRMRPVNAMVENPRGNMRSNTLNVRNLGPMEFPIDAAVGGGQSTMMGGGQSTMGGGVMGGPMMSMGGGDPGFGGGARQQRQRNGLAGREGAYGGLAERPNLDARAKRGERVQGGALRTFPLDYSVEAVQVTITTQGLPMNAKVELWGTSSHIKQLAEVYNDNGATRPFSAIIDCPGGSNTIAVYNTGPMEYPIEVVVEPVSRMEGWNGREERFGGHLAPW